MPDWTSNTFVPPTRTSTSACASENKNSTTSPHPPHNNLPLPQTTNTIASPTPSGTRRDTTHKAYQHPSSDIIDLCQARPQLFALADGVNHEGTIQFVAGTNPQHHRNNNDNNNNNQMIGIGVSAGHLVVTPPPKYIIHHDEVLGKGSTGVVYKITTNRKGILQYNKALSAARQQYAAHQQGAAGNPPPSFSSPPPTVTNREANPLCGLPHDSIDNSQDTQNRSATSDGITNSAASSQIEPADTMHPPTTTATTAPPSSAPHDHHALQPLTVPKDQEFALKLVPLLPSLHTPEDIARIKHEGQCLQRCGNFFSILGCHHNETIDIGGHCGLLALVLDIAPAGDLRSFVRKAASSARRRYLSEYQIGLMFAQLLLALHHCHANGVMHRDIKTANIFIANEDAVDGTSGSSCVCGRQHPEAIPLLKLGDFGYSRCYFESNRGAGDTVFTDMDERIGQTLCGTPNYTAPELLRRRPYSRKADIYSLGVVLHELLSGNGTRPYEEAVNNCQNLNNQVIAMKKAFEGQRTQLIVAINALSAPTTDSEHETMRLASLLQHQSELQSATATYEANATKMGTALAEAQRHLHNRMITDQTNPLPAHHTEEMRSLCTSLLRHNPNQRPSTQELLTNNTLVRFFVDALLGLTHRGSSGGGSAKCSGTCISSLGVSVSAAATSPVSSSRHNSTNTFRRLRHVIRANIRMMRYGISAPLPSVFVGQAVSFSAPRSHPGSIVMSVVSNRQIFEQYQYSMNQLHQQGDSQAAGALAPPIPFPNIIPRHLQPTDELLRTISMNPALAIMEGYVEKITYSRLASVTPLGGGGANAALAAPSPRIIKHRVRIQISGVVDQQAKEALKQRTHEDHTAAMREHSLLVDELTRAWREECLLHEAKRQRADDEHVTLTQRLYQEYVGSHSSNLEFEEGVPSLFVPPPKDPIAPSPRLLLPSPPVNRYDKLVMANSSRMPLGSADPSAIPSCIIPNTCVLTISGAKESFVIPVSLMSDVFPVPSSYVQNGLGMSPNDLAGNAQFEKGNEVTESPHQSHAFDICLREGKFKLRFQASTTDECNQWVHCCKIAIAVGEQKSQ